MCDYSLHTIASRPAKVGDKLITSKFPNSITHGFAAVGDPDVAVCLLPGTEISFEKEVKYRHPFAGILPGFRFGKPAAKVALFRHINLNKPDTHHDALEFADSRTLLLTQLCPGQRATVLQLPARPDAVRESVGQKKLLSVPG
jgi:hypothetical protein